MKFGTDLRLAARLSAAAALAAARAPRPLGHHPLPGGGTLSAGFLGTSPRRRAVIVKTDHPAFTYRGIAVEGSERAARRSMRRERVRRRRDGTRLLIARGKRRTLVVATRRRRVAFVAVARPRVSMKSLGRDLSRVR